MREIRVLVTLRVNTYDPIDPDALEDSVVEAVSNAVAFAEDNGFSHTYEDAVSIGLIDVVLYEG